MTTPNDGPPFGPVVNGTMVVVFWEYRPSNVAAYIFLALFALATLAHVGYLVWFRAWAFIPFVLGGICKYPLSLSPTCFSHHQAKSSATSSAPARTRTRQPSTPGSSKTCSSSSRRPSSRQPCTCATAACRQPSSTAPRPKTAAAAATVAPDAATHGPYNPPPLSSIIY